MSKRQGRILITFVLAILLFGLMTSIPRKSNSIEIRSNLCDYAKTPEKIERVEHGWPIGFTYYETDSCGTTEQLNPALLAANIVFWLALSLSIVEGYRYMRKRK